jgi:hypothetical protein
MRASYELLALALALEDDGLGDEEIVAALTAAAEDHVLRLQNAYASTLYLLQETPLDEGAQRLMRLFLQAMTRVAAHDASPPAVSVDTDWVERRYEADSAEGMAERLATHARDRQSIRDDARRLQADLKRLRRD